MTNINSEHHITITTTESLLDCVVAAVRSDTQKKKKIRFIVRKRVVLPTNGSDRDFEVFISSLTSLRFHQVWKFKQASTQKHTRTRIPGKGTLLFRGQEEMTLGSKGTEPYFTIEKGLRGSCYMGWLTTNKQDYFKLCELGDPMVPQEKGGLKWIDIVEHIYNSGEMEELRKKNGFDPKLKQELFFPSGKTDSGRCVSQFLLRLWFIINKC